MWESVDRNYHERGEHETPKDSVADIKGAIEKKLRMAIYYSGGIYEGLGLLENEDQTGDFSICNGGEDHGFGEAFVSEPPPSFDVTTAEEIIESLKLSIARDDAPSVQNFGNMIEEKDFQNLAQYVLRWTKDPTLWMQKFGRLEFHVQNDENTHAEIWLDIDGGAPTIASFSIERSKSERQNVRFPKAIQQVRNICRKYENKEQLTPDELRFLYEVDEPIDWFGFPPNPLIAEIISKRNKDDDMRLLGINVEAITLKDFIKPRKIGDMILRLFKKLSRE